MDLEGRLKWKIGILAGIILGTTAWKAKAEDPSMEIEQAIFEEDYNPNHNGNEIAIQYAVTNKSKIGDQNNMVEFVLPGGLNSGIYETIPADDWTLEEIGPDFTKFQGLLTPGDTKVFEIYSNTLTTTTGYASALALGEAGQYQPFNQVQVTIPGNPPPVQRLAFDVVNTYGEINQDDMEEFRSCTTGPSIAVPEGSVSTNNYDCKVFDIDGDFDIDQSDFGLFQRCMGQYEFGCTGLGDAEPIAYGEPIVAGERGVTTSCAAEALTTKTWQQECSDARGCIRWAADCLTIPGSRLAELPARLCGELRRRLPLPMDSSLHSR